MFAATEPFLFFDYFRIPYEVGGPSASRPAASAPVLHECARLCLESQDGESPALYWTSSSSPPGSFAQQVGPARFNLDGSSFFARVVPDADIVEMLVAARNGWHRTTAITDARGTRVASVWRDNDGNLLLPFDPSDAMRNYWSEAYKDIQGTRLAAAVKRAALWSYYRIRPILPRSTQIALRRLLSRVQARTTFPRWPVETGLHDLYEFLFQAVADLSGVPVPWISPWPAPFSWSIVLTHDVETSVGYGLIDQLQRVELSGGYRSSWNFVPMRYDVEDLLVKQLKADGFEVGVHGLYHDGRDLESWNILQERLPAIREHADRWEAKGFRSPATHRVWEWMPTLGFEYDSSYPDSDPFEPQSGGCCSWLPFFNRDLVELPITVPQDHTVFVILDAADERIWLEKVEQIRGAGGMALVLTHPDYLVNDRLLPAYSALLHRYHDDVTAWKALPGEISDWWRRRAASHLEATSEGWAVVGPAAGEASISYAHPS